GLVYMVTNTARAPDVPDRRSPQRYPRLPPARAAGAPADRGWAPAGRGRAALDPRPGGRARAQPHDGQQGLRPARARGGAGAAAGFGAGRRCAGRGALGGGAPGAARTAARAPGRGGAPARALERGGAGDLPAPARGSTRFDGGRAMSAEDERGVQPAFELRGVTRSFGQTRALERVDLAPAPGQIVGLIGRNGSGKTTLLRHVVGLQLPDEGTVRTLGTPSQELGSSELGRIG